jgi:flagellar protein FliS
VRAEVALEAHDLKSVNDSLQHAQRIVRVLRSALEPDGFTGGRELLSVYVFLENHLVKANLEKSVDVIRECANLIEPIRNAWTKAVQNEGG